MIVEGVLVVVVLSSGRCAADETGQASRGVTSLFGSGGSESGGGRWQPHGGNSMLVPQAHRGACMSIAASHQQENMCGAQYIRGKLELRCVHV